MRPYVAVLALLLAGCSTLVTVGSAAAGAAIGAAVGGPAGAAAGAVAGWGTAEGIEYAKLQATLTNKALDDVTQGWFAILMDSISPLIFIVILLAFFAPSPQDIWRRFRRKKHAEETTRS